MTKWRKTTTRSGGGPSSIAPAERQTALVGQTSAGAATIPTGEPANTDDGLTTDDAFKEIELATNWHLQPCSLFTPKSAEVSPVGEQHFPFEARQQAGCTPCVEPKIFGQRTSKCPSAQKHPANGRLAQRASGIITHSTAGPREFRFARVRDLVFTGQSLANKSVAA
jgi:hypothetical protein